MIEDTKITHQPSELNSINLTVTDMWNRPFKFAPLFVLVLSSLHAETEPNVLINLRKSWETARTQAVAPIDRKYEESLRSLKLQLTRQGDLDAAVAVDKELKKVVGEEKVELGKERREKAILVASSPHGYVLQNVKRGTRITFRYESGQWKAWGKFPTCNPDAVEIEGGDLCRVVLAKVSGNGDVGGIVATVPPGTQERVFTFEAIEDYPALAIRIGGKDGKFEGPGSVEYTLGITLPSGQNDTAKVVSMEKPKSVAPAPEAQSNDTPFGRRKP